MKVIDPQKYKLLMEEVERLVGTLSKRYPTVIQLSEIRACFEEGQFFIQISIAGAERVERIMRSVVLDLPPEMRTLLLELVKRWDACLD